MIFYYSATLWHAVGFTQDDALAITVITSVTNIVVTLVAIALVDRFGRKPLLIIGSLGMALTLGAMAWIFGTAPTAMARQRPTPARSDSRPDRGYRCQSVCSIFRRQLGSGDVGVAW